MAWRRRKAGRKRKADAKRYPSGGVKHERVEPTPELVARRQALGFAGGQAETDWEVDRLWAAGAIDDRAREAAQRLNGLMRGRLARLAAPGVALSRFHDARAMAQGPRDDEATLDLEYAAAVQVLQAARAGRTVLDVVCFQRCVAPGDRLAYATLRVGLAALAGHFARPQARRLEWARRHQEGRQLEGRNLEPQDLTAAANATTQEMHGRAFRVETSAPLHPVTSTASPARHAPRRVFRVESDDGQL